MSELVQLRIVNREGAETAVGGEIGYSLMEVIRKNGFEELMAILHHNICPIYCLSRLRSIDVTRQLVSLPLPFSHHPKKLSR